MAAKSIFVFVIGTDGHLYACYSQIGILAQEFPFSQSGGAFQPQLLRKHDRQRPATEREHWLLPQALKAAADLTKSEVRIRAAEVYQSPTVPPTATGFRIGFEDTQGTIAWLDVDDVGGLARPFDRHALDVAEQNGDLVKTMLSTYRFPGHCFVDANQKFQLSKVQAIHLGLNRGDKRPIAFDDLEIVKT